MSGGSIIKALRALKLVGAGEVVRMTAAMGSAPSSGAASDQERPRAYTGPYPIRSHRTVAEVDAGVPPR